MSSHDIYANVTEDGTEFTVDGETMDPDQFLAWVKEHPECGFEMIEADGEIKGAIFPRSESPEDLAERLAFYDHPGGKPG